MIASKLSYGFPDPIVAHLGHLNFILVKLDLYPNLIQFIEPIKLCFLITFIHAFKFYSYKVFKLENLENLKVSETEGSAHELFPKIQNVGRTFGFYFRASADLEKLRL